MARTKKELLKLPKVQALSNVSLKEQSAGKFKTMYQGTATNKLSTVSTKNIVINETFDNAIIEENGLKIFFENHNKVKAKLRISTQKLLDISIIYLTAINHYKESNLNKITTLVNIPLREYATYLGYNLTEKTMPTDEEQKKEKKRVGKVLDKIRAKVNEDLATLYSMSLSWTEPKGDKKGTMLDYKDIRILQSKGIKNGIIQIRFTEEIAHYLNNAYIGQYPTQLLSTDDRNPLVYPLGYKLAIHNSIENNVVKKTQNIIGIKSLIKAIGELQTEEEINSKDQGHWNRRIKERLEKALDILVSENILKYWEYSNSKGVPLKDNQISIESYNIFENLYIHFELIK